MQQYKFGEVILCKVPFAEVEGEKTRPVMVLDENEHQVRVVYASSQKVDGIPRRGEFHITDKAEMAAMGHTKPARYSFDRGGELWVPKSEIIKRLGQTPQTVLVRAFRAAKQMY